MALANGSVCPGSGTDKASLTAYNTRVLFSPRNSPSRRSAAVYEQKQLFDFILDRVEDTGAENGLKLPQAFGRWFAGMYFDKPQHFSIADGSGDGKVDLFSFASKLSV